MSIDQLLSDDNSTLNFPSIRPSLDLNFARTKSLDPRITFARSSSGSYVGPDGLIKYAGVNQPRFDHNPVTGESLGLLIEESRTNLISYSEQFDNSYWIKTTSSIQSNVTTAPDGNITADKLIPSLTGTTGGYVVKNQTYVSGTTYTASCFAKAAEFSTFTIIFQPSAFGSTISARFNLLSGTLSTITDSATASIQEFPNGWYRCTATATATATVSDGIQYRTSNIGNGKSGIYIWGAQLEVGAFPTSYIPTVASTRTRNADNASMTGTNFSSWYNSSEGTIWSNVNFGINPSLNNFPSSSMVFAISDNTSSNRITLFGLSGFKSVVTRYARTGITYLSNSAIINSSQNKFAFSFAKEKSVLSSNSTLYSSISSTNITYPIVNHLDIGNQNKDFYLNGTISRLTYYPKRLPDSQLQALTR